MWTQIAYNIDVVKSNIPEALEVLSDAVLNPRFTSWEVAEAVQKIEQDIKGLKENPQTVLLEVSITNTLFVSCTDLCTLSLQTLQCLAVEGRRGERGTHSCILSLTIFHLSTEENSTIMCRRD